MTVIWSLLVLAIVGTKEKSPEPFFDNYTDAYTASKMVKKPILMVLNPAKDSASKKVSYSEIANTEERRKLLENYIVAIVDTDTKHGKTVKGLFKNPKLPRVVVIDKKRKYQIFQSSEKMQGQVWTEVLKTYRSGEMPKRIVTRPSSVDCYT